VKTPEQAEENARAMEHGPLPEDAMARIDEILGRDGDYRQFAD
jgi:aryl-alcohol dehydrogenase-like predicted oxidoreductase